MPIDTRIQGGIASLLIHLSLRLLRWLEFTTVCSSCWLVSPTFAYSFARRSLIFSTLSSLPILLTRWNCKCTPLSRVIAKASLTAQISFDILIHRSPSDDVLHNRRQTEIPTRDPRSALTTELTWKINWSISVSAFSYFVLFIAIPRFTANIHFSNVREVNGSLNTALTWLS